MDRSGRRTAVIAWAIAAGVVLGGVATVPATALADDRGTDSSGGGDSGSVNVVPHRGVPSHVEAPTVAPPAGVRRPGSVTPSPSPDPPCPVDPCPWWWRPSSPPPKEPPGGIIVGMPTVPAVLPVPVFGNRRVVATGDLPDGDTSMSLPPLQPPESPAVGGSAAGSAPGAQGPGAPSALVAPSPVVPPAVPVVAAAPAGPSVRSLPDLPAPGIVGPVPAAPAARPGPPQILDPQGYLPELRPEDLGRIASTALPGLAALVGMTLLGGVIGYRQARAGYLLRAAGAGRFLR